MIGADYFYSFNNYILGDSIARYPINIFNPVYGTVPILAFASAANDVWSGTSEYSYFSSYQRKDLGVYAQDSITLFDNLRVLLGGRYDLADVKDGNGVSFNLASANFATTQVQHTGFFSPRVGVNFQPVPWIAFYGSYTRSFGQPNGISATKTPFAPQVAEGWEGGVKTELLDLRLTATFAFFDIVKSNILTSAPTVDNPLAQRPIGSVHSRGVELDVLGKLTDELSVIASYAHIDAKIVADNDGLAGNSSRIYAPDSGSLFLAYDVPGEYFLGGWRFGGGLYAASNRWGNDANTFILPAYARLDAFARYQTTIGPARVSAQINVTNIADITWYAGADTYFNTGSQFGIYRGAPRTVVGTLKVEF